MQKLENGLNELEMKLQRKNKKMDSTNFRYNCNAEIKEWIEQT